MIVETDRMTLQEKAMLDYDKVHNPRRYQATLEMLKIEQNPYGRLPGQKLDERLVQLIRFFLHSGISMTKISQVLGIGYYTLRDIKSKRTWGHLCYEPPDVFDTVERDYSKPKKFPFLIFKAGGTLMSENGDKKYLEGVTEEQAKEYLKEHYPNDTWELEVEDVAYLE